MEITASAALIVYKSNEIWLAVGIGAWVEGWRLVPLMSTTPGPPSARMTRQYLVVSYRENMFSLSDMLTKLTMTKADN